METRRRTLVKATVWQLLGVGTTTVTGWVFTGSVSQASAIALTGAICGFVVYFIHERVWSRTHWGQVKTHTEGRVEQAELSSRGHTLDTSAEVWCGGWNAALCELTRGSTRSTGYPADIRKMSDAKPDGTDEERKLRQPPGLGAAPSGLPGHNTQQLLNSPPSLRSH